MTSAADKIEAAMPELQSWIGRRQVVEDEIGLTTVRRIAAMLDMEPGQFVAGSALQPHWFSMFFCNNAMQRDLGPDGHPNPGVFLPPIPLPRRMGAGRRVEIRGALKAGEPARRIAEVVGITPKVARTGSMLSSFSSRSRAPMPVRSVHAVAQCVFLRKTVEARRPEPSASNTVAMP